MSQTKNYSDGSSYVGNFNDSGEKDGIGTLTFADRTKYHGEFKSGLFHGYGVMEIPGEKESKHKYQGQFSNGKFNGYGIFTQADGMKYIGQFESGTIQGLGRVVFKDNTNGVPHYEGNFRSGEIIERKLCPNAVELAVNAAQAASQR